MFTWAELQKLNVGQWFLNNHPYTLFPLFYPRAKRKNISRQKIMSLNHLAVLAAQHNKYLLFDLRRPPFGNTHFNTYIQLIIESVLSSGIEQSKVFWVLGPHANYVKAVAPGFKLLYRMKQELGFFKRNLISGVILEYNTITKSEIERYKMHDIQTIV
uniref:GP-PDE domain-containing protein n=1 Tax=Ciona savignyi TaxID=51511 RepID=H2Z3H3_CIOSA